MQIASVPSFPARLRSGSIGSSFTGGGRIAPSFLGSLCTSFLISPIMPPPTSSSRCAARFNSGLDGRPREGNIKQKGSEFSPSLLPFTWFGNTLSCMLFRATRLAGKAGQQPAAWPEDLGPYTVPYLKWKRSRLITGHILVRGQGEPPDL